MVKATMAASRREVMGTIPSCDKHSPYTASHASTSVRQQFRIILIAYTGILDGKRVKRSTLR
jgi:hypothetical protein